MISFLVFFIQGFYGFKGKLFGECRFIVFVANICLASPVGKGWHTGQRFIVYLLCEIRKPLSTVPLTQWVWDDDLNSGSNCGGREKPEVSMRNVENMRTDGAWWLDGRGQTRGRGEELLITGNKRGPAMSRSREVSWRSKCCESVTTGGKTMTLVILSLW